MPLGTIKYRTAGPWGAGEGGDLPAEDIDQNNYEFQLAIEDLFANPVQPEQIASIDVTGNQMTITLTDATVFGPFTLPIAEFSDRGAFADATDYVYGDIFTSGTYLVMVLQDHESDAPFNPAATNGFGPLYRVLFNATALTMTFLEDGYPAAGVDLHTFEVFSVPDDGVYMVLVDHDAVDPFDPDLEISGDPAYQKLFQAIETAVARIQFQYPGPQPSDESLIWKLIQDDPRTLTIDPTNPQLTAHLEVAVDTEVIYTFAHGTDELTLTFTPASLLDGDGGQFGAWGGDTLTVPTVELVRLFAPDTNGNGSFLTIALVGAYS